LLIILRYRKKLLLKCVIEGGSLLEGAKRCYVADQQFNASMKFYDSKLLITNTAQHKAKYVEQFLASHGKDKQLSTKATLTEEMTGNCRGQSVGNVKNGIKIAFDLSRSLYPNEEVTFFAVTNIPNVSNLTNKLLNKYVVIQKRLGYIVI
jgi:hypothetical protein